MSDPLSSTSLPRVFACYNKNKKILNKSSSGGVFYSIASEVITKYKGVVYGCVIDWDNVFHSRAETIDELMPMLGSKYVRSNLKNTFNECCDDLSKDRWVLYSGTPCQINALHFYLKNKSICTDKLLTVDIVCHGTPKIEYWREYLKVNFPKKQNPINFRYKKHGWENFYIKIGDYESPISLDPFFNAFLKNNILHESCYGCMSKGENRSSDITIGDFWGIDNIDKSLKNKNGTSLLVVRHKAHFILDILKRRKCKFVEVPYVLSIYNLNHAYYISVDKGENYYKPLNLRIDFSSAREKNTKQAVSFKHKIAKRFHSLGVVKKTIYHNKKKRFKNNNIGIITEIGYCNYGNRLQNYALITYLKSIGKNPTNIICYEKGYNVFHRFYNAMRGFKEKKRYKIKQSIYDSSIKYEGEPFMFSPGNKFHKKMCDFESIVIGSDQIWNCSYHKYNNDLKFSLGNFGIVNRNFKLISYSASMCVDKLNDNQKFLFRHSLVDFDAVSVREKQSEKLLDSIGVKSQTVVDPTLLLSKEEWNAAVEKCSCSPIENDKYNLVYFLGFNNVLPDCISKNDNKFVSFTDTDFTRDKNQFDFVNYIKNADIVVTDSFHAVVFSLIYKKKIVIVDRNLDAMVTRIENIFDLLNIPLEFNKIIDFGSVDIACLQNNISNSKQFLKETLD